MVCTVLVIAPWNYPYMTAINTVAPALIAGNTVMLKARLANTSKWVSGWREAFHASG